MKLRNFFEIIGFKKAAKRFGYEIRPMTIPDFGIVKYAQWKHPLETEKTIDPKIVAEHKKYIKPGDLCIDIGAHSGDSTIPMAIATGKTGLVLALEPNPYVYPVLEKNVRLNRETMNIFPIMAAASTEEGAIELEYSDAGYCNGGKHEGISVFRHGHAYKLLTHAINLSQELKTDFKNELPKFKFLKTDAEGFDLYILQSLEEVINTYKPFVKSEVFKKTSLEYRKKMLKFFTSKNYKIWVIHNDGDYLGFELNEENLFQKQHYDIFCIPNIDRLST
jgi:FkbM family methyltransferase